MGQANPYENFLDERTVDAILEATAGDIAKHLAAIGDNKANVPPAPRKWSAAEIVCHLADCELVFGFRLRQTLAMDEPIVQPFDQDDWAGWYKGVSAHEALSAFRALRKWNLAMLRAALPDAAGRKMTHPERGTMTLQAVVETMAGHDLNHLEQLRRLEGQAA